MFPALRFKISGLNPTKRYCVSIEIRSADKYRYKYHDSEWCITGRAFAETPRHQRLCIHGDSPSSGLVWTQGVVSFHKLKITNNTSCKSTKQVTITFYFFLGKCLETDICQQPMQFMCM